MAAVPSTIDPWALKRASLVYPMPVAMACGRVLRARTPQEKIDASLRAGEILARYLAAVALSSFAARDGDKDMALSALQGNLAYGHFLSLVQQVSKLNIAHPARPYIDAGFKPKKGSALGVTDAALQALLELRNELGHQLDTLYSRKEGSRSGARGSTRWCRGTLVFATFRHRRSTANQENYLRSTAIADGRVCGSTAGRDRT
jgi:hypothetical protein